MGNQADVNQLRESSLALPANQDVRLDLFTGRGFALAQRIANAYQTSNAVPAQFRQFIEKKVNGKVTEIENPSAFGNCLVAIETAQTVGMSITAVMQNADIIEGKLRWSGKFKIAAINASGLFTRLRFRITNRGRISAKYLEKTGWNDELRRYDMAEREVTVDDIECVAWAYRIEDGKKTDELVESVPVSMKMAVEEGWYAKPGSKWQTSLRDLMLIYRSGSFFGDTHAPDIVMGMGKTTEEHEDIIDVVKQPDGKYAAEFDATRSTSAPSAAPQSEKNAGATTVEPNPVARTTATATESELETTTVGSATASSEPAGSKKDAPDMLAIAMDAVKSGDFDTANDIARSLPLEQKVQIEDAIAAKRQPNASAQQDSAQPRRQRQQRSFDMQ
ncbi:hypothetical protein [Cupriavidus basilensis]|uniref:hypothetical protein n=1 Tax=Cupriavidus basilensis TaxID=68895 RepID=UPI000695B889|nr:hypothetical protein [Cupriavidus basilensis]